MMEKMRVKAGAKVRLKEYDPGETFGWKKGAEFEAELARTLGRLDELQYLLYAEDKHTLQVVLQGMDASGKDGTIRRVMTGMNPQGVKVKSFKQPTAEELDHDFLWRIHCAVAGKGEVGVFNRSHYEDVLVVRVHNLVAEKVWRKRYKQINRFEHLLTENNVVLLKFFLHISKGEQLERFRARVTDPKKNWKVSAADFSERKYWKEYMRAYEEALAECSTEEAPWYVVPADKKWFRDLAVAKVMVEALEGLEMKLPKAKVDLGKIRLV